MSWFYAAPAHRGEALLHRVHTYRVDELERDLRVEGVCGLSLAATTARLVADPTPDDPRCSRCLGRRPTRRLGRQKRRGILR